MKGTALVLFLALGIQLLIPLPMVLVFPRILLVVLGLSWLIARVSRTKMTIGTEFPRYMVFAHEKQEIVLWIANNSPFPLDTLGIHDETGGLHCPGGSSGAFSCRGREKHRFSYTVWSEQRGVYTLGPTSVAGIDPLGFFPWVRSFSKPIEVTVFPPIYPSDALLARSVLGQTTGSTWLEHQDPLETKAVRPWQPGDDVRSIHWKQTAKFQEPMVREYPLQQVPTLIVLLNLRDQDFTQKRKHAHRERCIEAAAAILVQGHSQGFHSTLHVLGTSIEPSTPGITGTLEQLAHVQGDSLPRPLGDFLGSLALRNRPLLVCISPPLVPGDFETLCTAARTLYRPRWIIIDEQVDRKDRIGLSSRGPGNPFCLYRISELTEGPGELYE